MATSECTEVVALFQVGRTCTPADACRHSQAFGACKISSVPPGVTLCSRISFPNVLRLASENNRGMQEKCKQEATPLSVVSGCPRRRECVTRAVGIRKRDLLGMGDMQKICDS